jgi:Sulfatase
LTQGAPRLAYVLPNVVIIVLDAARRDAFETYGAAAGSSPAIAQLAHRGRTLEEVYATGCWTVPSHVSMFTGLMPRSLGLAGVPGGSPADVRAHMDRGSARMLPAVLRDAGYSTLAASANLWVSPECGFDAGVDDFQSVDSGRQVSLAGGSLRSRLSRWKEAISAQTDDGAAEIERTLLPRLVEAPEPFFCFVNLIESHSPYLAPEPFTAGSALERMRAMDDAARHYTLAGVWRTCLGGLELSAAAAARLRKQYAASIRAMDAWVGRLLETLDSSGRLDETLVVVTADHGENFGEGGLIAHALSLDNRLIHVPFVVSGPLDGASLPTSLAGVPRFVAESAGLQDHPWPADELPHGIGIGQHDPPVESGDPRLEIVRGDWGLDEEALRRMTSSLTCAVRGTRKLLVDDGRELWFNLDDDPLEVAPLSPGELPEAELPALTELRAALNHPSVTSVVPFQPNGGLAEGAADTADLEERMRLLGYL